MDGDTINLRHVQIPEAGSGAHLRFDVDGLESLQNDFGDFWLHLITVGLQSGAPVIVARCLALAVREVDEIGLSDAPWGLTTAEIGERLDDALTRFLYGKSAAAIAEERERDARIATRKAEAAAAKEPTSP